MKRILILGLAIVATLLSQGCANTVDYDKRIATSRIKTNLTTDDLKRNVGKMIDNMSADSGVMSATKGTRPVLAVFGVIDFTNDKVDLAGINGHVLNSLNQSNRFRFSDPEALIAASSNLENSLYDLVEQDSVAAKLANALDADFILVGEISNVVRTKPKIKQVYYRITLKLLDANTGTFIWQDQNELLKLEKSVIYGI